MERPMVLPNYPLRKASRIRNHPALAPGGRGPHSNSEANSPAIATGSGPQATGPGGNLFPLPLRIPRP
jgi:hypothetical protein